MNIIIALVLVSLSAIGAEATDSATSTGLKTSSQIYSEIYGEPDFKFDENSLDEQKYKIFIKHGLELSASANYPNGFRGSAQVARYMPEFSLSNYYITDDFRMNVNAILNLTGQLYYPTDTTQPDENKAYVDIYRLWARFAYAGVMQTTIGKQQIKFGNGFIFRPLSWFDSIKFYDQLKYSPARHAILLSVDPTLFSRISFWGMYYNEQSFGYNAFSTERDSFSFGGRAEWMSSYSVLGLSYNNRKVDVPSQFQSAINDTGREDAFGLDLKLTFLTMNLFSDVSYSKVSDLGTSQADYAQWQHNTGLSLLLPVKGINYNFVAEYFYTRLLPDVGATSGNSLSLLWAYDLIFSVGVTSTDYLSFIWMDGRAQNLAGNDLPVQSLMMRWQRSFNYMSYGLNVYVNKGFDFKNTDGIEGQENENDVISEYLLAPSDEPIYGIQASFKYTFTTEYDEK